MLYELDKFKLFSVNSAKKKKKKMHQYNVQYYAFFHHGLKNKKPNCNFLCYNYDFLLAIVSLYFTI